MGAHSESCLQTEVAIDMRQRYVGHCNTGTDIKQASFLGERGLSLSLSLSLSPFHCCGLI